MLTVTRKEVEQFLEQEKIPYRTDSSNLEDTFLRNRLHHHVMPLLQQENQNIAAALSATALRLRQDDMALDTLAVKTDRVDELLAMSPAVRSRVFRKLLISWGVPEPEAGHVELLDRVVRSQNPSAFGVFPGGVIVARNYDRLVKQEQTEPLGEYPLQCPGRTPIPQLGAEVVCTIPGETPRPGSFRVHAVGEVVLRGRKTGDTITLPGGTKRLKKLFIDRKIPADRRGFVPVVVDSVGVLAVGGFAVATDRTDGGEAVKFVFQ
jgi:tRNA(Ile)-lysidine synthase